MFEGLLLRWQTRVDALMKSWAWAAVAGVAMMTAIVFFAVAIFIRAQDDYGTIRTCLGFAGFFLAVALIAAVGLALVRRNARRRAALVAQSIAQSAPPWWLDPQLLSTGLSVGKTLGGRRALSVGVVAAFVIGMLLSRGAGRR